MKSAGNTRAHTKSKAALKSGAPASPDPSQKIAIEARRQTAMRSIRVLLLSVVNESGKLALKARCQRLVMCSRHP
jgi:hypothetical protein